MTIVDGGQLVAPSPPVVPEADASGPPAGRRRRPRGGAWITRVAWGIVLLVAIAAVLAPLLTDVDPEVARPQERHLAWGEDGHPLGTDQLGRDVLVRLLYGARLAFVVGLSVSVLAVAIGGTLGVASGYLGGIVDTVVTRVVDALLAFPPLLLALVGAAILGPSTSTAIVALGIVYTPLVTRVSRAAVIGERQLDYVDASRGLGNRETRTLFRHLLPNVLGALLVVASVVLSRAIIVEASLSFLGAGTQAPTPNWGVMIAEARALILTKPSLVIVPAVVLSVTLLAINVVSDAIADRFDPSSAARRQH